MVVGSSSRTRIFTATWPAFVSAKDTAASTRVGGKEHAGPFCQVLQISHGQSFECYKYMVEIPVSSATVYGHSMAGSF